MTHLSKKRKLDEVEDSDSKELFVFDFPGQKPDTRIIVFSGEFQVHSTVLKRYSAFFRKFMDSPDKTPGPATVAFYYSYTAVIDEDGDGWGLYPIEKVSSSSFAPLKSANKFRQLPENSEDLQFEAEREKEAFYKLICAMYHIRTEISCFNQLSEMTRQADFFCSLPILSSSLFSSLWMSPRLNSELRWNENPGLELAVKLRHPVLFREMAVLAISGYNFDLDPDRFEFLGDKASFALTRAALRVRQLEVDISRLLVDTMYSLPTASFRKDVRKMEARLDKKFEEYGKKPSIVRYHQKLYSVVEETLAPIDYGPHGGVDPPRYHGEEDLLLELRDKLKELLTNNLVHCKDQDLPLTEGDSYFCASVPEEDLPWDVSQSDW